MRYFFLILALQTLLFSSQPIWQAACEQWSSLGCTMVCEASTTCSAPANADGEEETEVPQCCPPFQCCFLSFPGFSTPYILEVKEYFEKKAPPQAAIKTLRSAYLSDCFHPPEMLF